MGTEIKKSGNKVSVKTTGSIAWLLGAIRIPQPQKGTKNPPHLQTNLPKSLVNKKQEKP